MKKTVLVILDGFGLGEDNLETNAIAKAKTPFLDAVKEKYHYAKLLASEEAVGIAKGQFGNSEIGHMTIGAGQVIYGVGEYATKLIDDNQFEEYLLQQAWVQQVLKEKDTKVLHLCGLYSSGGVHSNKKHLDAIIQLFEKYGVRMSLNLFSDGRDTSKFVFYDDVKELLSWIKPTTWISSVSGRYFGMDRDQRWERTNLAFDAITDKLNQTQTVLEYIQAQYNSGKDDEFIEPASFHKDGYQIQTGDTLCFFNFRADRMRQMFHKFKETNLYDKQLCQFEDLNVISICEYSNTTPDHVMFEKVIVQNTLGSVLIDHKVKQLRVAETEKFAHVTFFFDGGREIVNDLQKHILVPSPAVSTYDLQPAMSAELITDTIIKSVDEFEVCVVNYANADMVGHTGNFEATVEAIEVLDKELAKLYNTIVEKYDGNMLITADHGNADCMSRDHVVVKTHTVAPVPFIVMSNGFDLVETNGSLQDVTPTILYMLGIERPTTMTGRVLVKKK
ncbi:2,3-bisphosphoglycerate-independent phosphoglycerate mutase [Ureaplasma ceti]